MKQLRFNLSNPVVTYTLVWLLTLFLISLGATKNLHPINYEVVLLVGSNIILFWVIYIIFTTIYPKKNIPRSYFDDIQNLLLMLRSFVKKILCIWLIGTIIEIIVSGGVPIVWTILKINKHYVDFGIPTFHGLMNAFYLFSVTTLFLDYCFSKNRKELYKFFILLLWPVIMIERGILLGAILQAVAIYLLINKVKFTTLLKLVVVTLCVIILFGLIGTMRGHAHIFENLVVDKYKWLFTSLPSGFLWFYVYITSPLNNIISNIDTIVPTYFPFYSSLPLLPSVIRNIMAPGVNLNPLNLEIANLNVSSFYAGFLADFGIFGTILLVSVIQFIIIYFYILARQLKIWAMLAYAVLFQCIVFSIFYNLFFSMVYIMQIFIALFFKWTIDSYAKKTTPS